MKSPHLERYKKRLEMYYEAEEAVLLNQEYTIGTKSLKRADLSTIFINIFLWRFAGRQPAPH